MSAPHFYCEKCGNSVSLNADSCSSCGRRFDAVKCPECGFSGKAVLFTDGCPSCGYLSSLTSILSGPSLKSTDIDPNADFGIVYAGRRSSSRGNKKVLPAWLYTVITIGLIGFLVFLLVTYLKLE